jgi:hypothetical protein
VSRVFVMFAMGQSPGMKRYKNESVEDVSKEVIHFGVGTKWSMTAIVTEYKYSPKHCTYWRKKHNLSKQFNSTIDPKKQKKNTWFCFNKPWRNQNKGRVNIQSVG